MEEIINILTNNLENIGRAIIVAGIFIILSPQFTYLILKIFNFKKNRKEIKKISFYKPVKLFFIVLGIYAGIMMLYLPSEYTEVVTKVFKIIIILLVANGFSNMASPESKTFMLIQKKLDLSKSQNVTRIICRVLKILIYIITGYIIITELGYDLGGLAAGLGIGTAIIALAVQDVAKNLLGGLTILTDKIFVVGDYIKVGEVKGTVENITFRSTRLKTDNGTDLTIPNGVLANQNIENFSRMKKRRIEIDLSFDYSISYETLSKVKYKIQLFLKEYPHVLENSININLSNLEADGMNLNIYFYTDYVSYADNLKFKGEINEVILSIIEKENIYLGFINYLKINK